MSQACYPFDAGAGSGVPDEAAWSNMLRSAWRGGEGVIRHSDRTYDLNRLEVYADSTGMRVKVKSGRAQLRGFHYVSDAEEILTIAAANPSNPRIDRVVLHLDTTANTAALEVMAGTAAASPVAVTITNTATQFYLPLAQVRVNAAVSTIAAGNVTREEPSLISGYTPACVMSRGAVQSIPHNTPTNVVWTSTIRDTDSMAASGGPVCRAAGHYDLDVSLEWSTAYPNGLRIAYLSVNRAAGGAVVVAKSAMTATAGETAQNLSTNEYLFIGDSVSVAVVQSNGSSAALDLLAVASNSPRLAVTYKGP